MSSPRMRLEKLATLLLEVFLAAVVLALAVTLESVSMSVKLLALALVSPLLALGLVLVFFCRRGVPVAFAVASILGVVGVALRLVVNAHPSLEVGGGLPLWVTILYAGLGASLALASLGAWLSLRRKGDQALIAPDGRA